MGRARPWLRDALVVLGFAAISCVYAGRPLLHHPGRVILGSGPDPSVPVWFFGWWPHAIATGSNPIMTHAIYAPAGIDLAWTTAMPTLALAFSPLTAIVGPVIAVNVAVLLLPAIAAWTAFRLCLALTRSAWASVVGGYLFGFSSFMLAQQLQIHVSLTASFLLPLVALSIVRFVRGDWSRRRYALCFGVLVALQLGISTEVALTTALMLAIVACLAALLDGGLRSRLWRELVPVTVAGYAAGAVLASPLLVYALRDAQRRDFTGGSSGTDLVNLAVPTSVNGLFGSSFTSLQRHLDVHESVLYLGWPVLLIVAFYAWEQRRSREAWVLLASLVAAVVLALGPRLVVAGHDVAPLPWLAIEKLPGFVNVHVPRFGAYVALFACMIVALWIAQARGRVFRRPYVLPALAVAALVPAFWHAFPLTRPQTPAFFAAGLDRSCLQPGETIAVLPYTPVEDVYQAQAGYRFHLAGGYLSSLVFGLKPIVSFNADPTVVLLDFYGDRGQPSMDAIWAFAKRHDVDRIVALPGVGYPTRRQLEAFGPVQSLGGVYVAPACGTAPLTARSLPASARRVAAEQARGTTIRYCLDGYTYDLRAGLDPGGLLQNATRAVYVAGHGLACSPPAGYRPRGYAPASAGVPPDTYRYYVA
jgi:hypothetical protein